MNQTLVAKVKDKSVYLVNNDTVPFYICIPTEKNASIVLNLVSNPTEINLTNNMQGITSAITGIYNNFEDNNIAVVTPIIDSNLLEQAKLNNSEQIFSYLDQSMSFLINTVYKILTSNNYQVENIIKLNDNHSYSAFNNWFVNRYNGRVALTKYNKENVIEKDPTLIMDSFKQPATEPAAPVQTPISTPTPPQVEKPNPNTALADEVLEQTQSLSVGEDNEQGFSRTKEPGFVSYVLLGVIVAVISLVILYKLL